MIRKPGIIGQMTPVMMVACILMAAKMNCFSKLYILTAMQELYGAEIYITTTDFQDTLKTHVFSSSENPDNEYWDTNFFELCLEEGVCYYMDVHLPEERHNLPGSHYVFTSFPEQYYLPFLSNSTVTSHFRSLVGPNSIDCGFVGCTDPYATNFNPVATQNFNCSYCDDNYIKITPEFNFSGNMNWELHNDTGQVAQGSFDNNNPLIQDIACVEDGCYEFKISGDAWYFNSLKLWNMDDELITEMSLTMDGEAVFPFGINTENCGDENEVYGCTNPLGQNYNSQATIDDGSCDLQNAECNLELDAFLDTLGQQIIIQSDVYSTDYPIYLFWDMGDGTPLFDSYSFSGPDGHVYENPGVYEVCAYLYTLQFSEQEPLCYDQVCITVDTELFGFQGAAPVFLADSTLSTREIQVNPLSLYPNPASQQVNIQGFEGTVEVLRLHDASGAAVEESYPLRNAADHVVLDVSKLASGMYIVQLLTSEGAYVGRLVVKH